MRPTRFCAFLIATLIPLCLANARAQADPDAPMANDLIHADLPLYGDGTTEKWPRAFQTAEDFGCESRVSFGDWELRRVADAEDSEWFRVSNYGVFHCWANVTRADRREGLANVDVTPAFFVLLGTTKAANHYIDLWALQLGARPGSDYLLLSRPREAGAVETFSVLQTECPRGHTRNGGSLSILITRYCAINSPTELLRLAQRMARRPVLGALIRVADDTQQQGAAHE